jgi:hypothetical protein
VREPVHHVGEELVRQALDRLVRIVEVDQQDLRVILQLRFSLIKQSKSLTFEKNRKGKDFYFTLLYSLMTKSTYAKQIQSVKMGRK